MQMGDINRGVAQLGRVEQMQLGKIRPGRFPANPIFQGILGAIQKNIRCASELPKKCAIGDASWLEIWRALMPHRHQRFAEPFHKNRRSASLRGIEVGNYQGVGFG